MGRITVIRRLKYEDDASIGCIICNTLAEFGANKPGTVFFDEITHHLSDVFVQPLSYYFVLEEENKILGGAGIFPSSGLPDGICELVKMYLLPEARNKGFGKMLIEKCIEKAKEFGYKKIYIETMPELTSALPLYEKYGWKYLEHSMGNTGHFGCGLWMLKEL